MDVLHIAVFGPVNSGKSTLVNALAGQEVSLVSDVPGTTTDPVRKRIELPGLGPCVLIDTAGVDDDSLLGPERERRTRAILDEADIAVLVHADTCHSERSEGIPAFLQDAPVPVVHYERGQSIESLLERIRKALPEQKERFLTASLVAPGGTVVLVMPQDGEAPKGRLILPQVRVIRELLDRGCIPVCCTPDTLPLTLAALNGNPDLVITDSQVFRQVEEAIPQEVPLTSFSILLAGEKGDIRVFVEGARAIDTLDPGSRVLIAEACSHVPASEDIGRVKIPALLRRRGDMAIDVSAGNDFPEDLTGYDLIIHCGACVATGNLVAARIRKALLAGVPITNYGIASAKLQGILDRVALP